MFKIFYYNKLRRKMVLDFILDKMEYFNCILVFLVFLGERIFFIMKIDSRNKEWKLFFFIIYIWIFILKDIEGYEINYYDIFLK